MDFLLSKSVANAAAFTVTNATSASHDDDDDHDDDSVVVANFFLFMLFSTLCVPFTDLFQTIQARVSYDQKTDRKQQTI